KTICAAIILLAAAVQAHAQSASTPSQKGNPVSTASPDVVKSLAPTGKLRVAINLGNSVLAQGTPDKPTGITPELARELGKRPNVPAERTPYEAAGKAFESVKAGKTDVLFLAIEPVRAAEIAFTAPYVLIEGVYMVPKGSSIQSPADVDKSGVRIAVGKASAY